MGCVECEVYWDMRFNRKFVIEYEGGNYVVPDIDLSRKVEDVWSSIPSGEVMDTLEGVTFKIREAKKGHESRILQKSDFRDHSFEIIAYLLKKGELDKYK